MTAPQTSSTPSSPARADAATPTATSPGRANLQLGVIGLGALAVSLAQSVLVPVLGILPAQLDVSASTASWLITATLLVAAVAVPIMGRLGDMFGRRLLLLVALGALTLGSLLTAVTDNITLLITGRAIQGLSSAAIPLGISLVAGILPRDKAGTGIAVISAMLGVGGALGLPMAGLVAEHTDFHALFWITAAVGLVSFAGVLAVVPEPAARAGGRIDVLGSALLAGAVVTLLLPLTESATWGWGDPRVAILLAASVVLFVTFGWSQTRVRDPLVDLRALRRPPIVVTNLASVLFGFALFASFIGTATFVQSPASSGYGFGSSLLVGGLTLLPSGLAMLVFSPVAARLIRVVGAPKVLALGAVVVALGWTSRIVLTGQLWEVFLGATVVGIGTGIGYASMPALINGFSPAEEMAAANGLNTLFRSLGSSLASALGSSILAADTVILGDLAVPSLTAYRELFALCAGAAVVAALLALVIPRLGSAPDRAVSAA